MEATVVRAALVAIALSACAHAKPDLDTQMSEAVDKVMVTSGEWAEIDDADVRAYVRAVGMRLVRAAGDDREWRFRVVDDPEVQGEANTGTTVYVTRGALARLRDEAELAGLLGHEIGHVLAGHAHDALVEKMRDVFVDTHDRDRDDEIQADELAVLLTAKAGYDPRAVETMLRALAAGDPPGDDTGTHPPWPERLLRVRALAAQLPTGEHDARAYLLHMRTLVVGDDPRMAATVGNAIVLARAGIAIDLPPGTVSAVIGTTALAAVAGDAVAVKPMTRELAKYTTAKSEPGMETFVWVGRAGAAMIAITGDDPRRALAALHMRAPRPAELAQIHPQLVDFAAPRALYGETKIGVVTPNGM
jgi:predicted Zn-dependent protease